MSTSTSIASLTDAVNRLSTHAVLKERNHELQQRLEAAEDALTKARHENSELHNLQPQRLQALPSVRLNWMHCGRSTLHRPSQNLRNDTMETLDVKLGAARTRSPSLRRRWRPCALLPRPSKRKLRS